MISHIWTDCYNSLLLFKFRLIFFIFFIFFSKTVHKFRTILPVLRKPKLYNLKKKYRSVGKYQILPQHKPHPLCSRNCTNTYRKVSFNKNTLLLKHDIKHRQKHTKGEQIVEMCQRQLV